MKKILFFIYIILNLNFLYAENIKIKSTEDIQIENLQNEIQNLENKIEILKKIKNEKDNKELKIGLVLSGGGAKGYAHLGVLKVLEKEKIKIDYITGTSVGALIGTLYSMGYTIAEIETVLDKLSVENFLESGTDISNLSLDRKESLKKYSFYINFDNDLNYSLPKGLRETETMYLEVKNLTKKFENIKNFDDFPIPIRIITTNLNTGMTEAFSKGDIAKVLTASMAIPTILEPVEINGNLYVDGLVSRNLPVQNAYDMGADIVIASNIGTSVMKKENYNILSVLNQMIAIQSSYITNDSREKASILIEPDLKNISATDTSKKLELIELGEKATIQQLSKISNLPKVNENHKNKVLITKSINDKFSIKKIEYDKKFDTNTVAILDNIFKPLLDEPISEDDIEKKIIDIYNLKYVNKLYYHITDNILYLEGEKGHLNRIGLGVDYRTGYGATFNIGTDLFFDGKFGNNLNLNAKIGDYLGADLGILSYYGVKNKVGIMANIGYNESPFFMYDNKKKLAKYTTRDLFFNLGLFTQLTNNTMLSYGILSNISSLRLDTGNETSKTLEYSDNPTKTYIRLKFDKLDSITNPMKGLKVDAIYNFASSLGSSKSNLYGPSYSIKGYIPTSKRSAIIYGLNSAILRGDNIRANQYIKLGGMYSNIENNEFEFYGFNFQEKQVKEFFSFTLGFKRKLIYSLYFNAKYNVATFTENKFLDDDKNRNRFWKDFSHGLGVSLNYDSPIGPIEFSVGTDLKNKNTVGSISIGYKLD